MQRFLAYGILTGLAVLFVFPALRPGWVLFPFHTTQLKPWRADVPADRLAAMDAQAVGSMADKVIQLHLYYVAARDALAAGEFPWWHHGLAGGFPLLGIVMPGLLYPLHWPFLFLDPLDWYAWHLVIHLLLASALMYALLRRLDLSEGAALLGAVAFAFNGWMAARAQYHVMIAAAAWVPAMFLGIHDLLHRPHPRAFVLVAASVGLSLLAGFPQVTVIALNLAGLATLVGLLWRWRRETLRAIVAKGSIIAAAVVIGLMIALPQLISGFTYQQRWARRTADPDTLRQLTLEPAHLLTMLWPTAYVDVHSPPLGADRTGSHVPPFLQLMFLTPRTNEPGRSAEGEELPGTPSRGFLSDNLAETTAYVGILPLILLATIPLVGTSRWGVLAAALAALSALVAYGAPPIISSIVRWLPGYGLSAPSRYLFGVVAALSVLSAVQLDRLRQRSSRWVNILLLGLLVVGLLGMGAAVVLGWRDPAEMGRALYGVALRKRALALGGPTAVESLATLIRPHDYAWNFERTVHAMGHASLVLAASSLALYFCVTRKSRAVLLLPVVVLAADLHWFFGAWTAPVERAGLYASHPVIEAIKARAAARQPVPARLARAGVDPSGGPADYLFPGNMLLPSGVDDIQGYTLTSEGYEQLLNLIEPGTRRYGMGVSAPRNLAHLNSPLFDLLGVDYVVIPAKLSSEQSTALDAWGFRTLTALDDPAFAREDLTVLENRQALPRAFVARQAYRPRDAGEMLRLLSAPDLHVDCVLLDPATTDHELSQLPHVDSYESCGHAGGDEGKGARVQTYAPSRVSLDVDLMGAENGYVVLSDTWAPGWEAWVDGRPAKVLRVDDALRAVPVQGAGTHSVQLRYRERSVELSMIASLGAIVGLTMLWLRGRSREPATAPQLTPTDA